jgi:hypothetical protein
VRYTQRQEEQRRALGVPFPPPQEKKPRADGSTAGLTGPVTAQPGQFKAGGFVATGTANVNSGGPRKLPPLEPYTRARSNVQTSRAALRGTFTNTKRDLTKPGLFALLKRSTKGSAAIKTAWPRHRMNPTAPRHIIGSRAHKDQQQHAPQRPQNSEAMQKNEFYLLQAHRPACPILLDLSVRMKGDAGRSGPALLYRPKIDC